MSFNYFPGVDPSPLYCTPTSKQEVSVFPRYRQLKPHRNLTALQGKNRHGFLWKFQSRRHPSGIAGLCCDQISLWARQRSPLSTGTWIHIIHLGNFPANHQLQKFRDQVFFGSPSLSPVSSMTLDT